MGVIKGRENFVPACPYVPQDADEARQKTFICGGGKARACRICPSRATSVRPSRQELVSIGVPSLARRIRGKRT